MCILKCLDNSGFSIADHVNSECYGCQKSKNDENNVVSINCLKCKELFCFGCAKKHDETPCQNPLQDSGDEVDFTSQRKADDARSTSSINTVSTMNRYSEADTQNLTQPDFQPGDSVIAAGPPNPAGGSDVEAGATSETVVSVVPTGTTETTDQAENSPDAQEAIVVAQQGGQVEDVGAAGPPNPAGGSDVEAGAASETVVSVVPTGTTETTDQAENSPDAQEATSTTNNATSMSRLAVRVLNDKVVSKLHVEEFPEDVEHDNAEDEVNRLSGSRTSSFNSSIGAEEDKNEPEGVVPLMTCGEWLEELEESWKGMFHSKCEQLGYTLSAFFYTESETM